MIDVYVTVDSESHGAFRRPNRVAEALADKFDDAVRSVTVIDSSTGLTAACRYDEN